MKFNVVASLIIGMFFFCMGTAFSDTKFVSGCKPLSSDFSSSFGILNIRPEFWRKSTKVRFEIKSAHEGRSNSELSFFVSEFTYYSASNSTVTLSNTVDFYDFSSGSLNIRKMAELKVTYDKQHSEALPVIRDDKGNEVPWFEGKLKQEMRSCDVSLVKEVQFPINPDQDDTVSFINAIFVQRTETFKKKSLVLSRSLWMTDGQLLPIKVLKVSTTGIYPDSSKEKLPDGRERSRDPAIWIDSLTTVSLAL